MSYALIRRVNDVRLRLQGEGPPAASVAREVLRLWSHNLNSYAIADRLHLDEHEVCRIIAADQDCRRFRKFEAA